MTREEIKLAFTSQEITHGKAVWLLIHEHGFNEFSADEYLYA